MKEIVDVMGFRENRITPWTAGSVVFLFLLLHLWAYPIPNSFGGNDHPIVKTFKVNFLKAEDLVQTLQTVLSPSGKIVASKTQNMLVVMDYPQNVDSVWKVLQELDRPQKNIRVSIEFVEESELEKINIDVDWLFRDKLWQVGTFGSSNPADQFGPSVDAELLETGVYSLNRQFLLLQDGMEGRIFVGESIPFREVFSQFGYIVPATNYRDVGSSFLVKPTLLADDRINIVISPEFSYATGKEPETIVVNQAVTEVKVLNGHPLILAGNKESSDDFSTRFLNTLRKEKSARNVLMIVTATIQE